MPISAGLPFKSVYSIRYKIATKTAGQEITLDR